MLFLKVEEKVQINQGEIGARAAEERATIVQARIRTDTPYAELSHAQLKLKISIKSDVDR